MNLVDSLLKADVKTVEELETSVFKSKKLAKVIGAEEAVEVKIREIGARRINDLVSYQVDKKGQFDISRTFDTKLMICVEGCVDPDLRNEELKAHFNCKSANELAEKLFGSEVNTLSDAISSLSGIGAEEEEETEEEIKN